MFRRFYLYAFFILLAACISVDEIPLPTITSLSKKKPPILSTEQSTANQAWEESPHAHTYGEEKGPNTYCAQCHSPENWDPSASIDQPPNCVTCKFPDDPEIRIAEGNTFIPSEQWKGIGCEICHKVESGLVTSQVAWKNVVTGYYETVATSKELCEKCHREADTLNHGRGLGTQAHQAYLCTDCHDPHSTKASCVSSECHATMVEPTPIGHDPAHSSIDCVVCHDASGLVVDKLDDRWVTLRTLDLLGSSSIEVYQSHNLQNSVDCTRCHYPGNRWGLTSEQ
jgi:hypothetical protein